MSNSRLKDRISDSDIINISKNVKSATEAASLLGVRYDTYRRHAKRLGVFATNQSRKGVKRDKSEYFKRTIPLEEIINGKHPHYGRAGLKRKLIAAGLIQPLCEICGIDEWNKKPLTLHLDHIDGNTYNHTLNNLRLLCPNCHSQTETYCGRNKK